jgi:hypothetical protein
MIQKNFKLKNYLNSLREVPNSWFILAVALSVILFLILFVNFSFIIKYFPISAAHEDFNGHMVKVDFMKNYGFNEVPNWYNGFYPFRTYYFGYLTFTLPIYLLFGNLNLATFISVVLIYIFAFLGCLFFSKIKGGFKNKKRSILFFILFFFNPVILFDSLHLGRLPELFGWLFFLFQSLIIFNYKDKRIDNKFIISYSIVSALLILSGPMIFFLSLSLLAGLFLVKNFKEKIKIVLSFIGSLILTSFWWLPIFIRNEYSQISSFYGPDYMASIFIRPSSLLFLFKNWYHDLAILAFLFVLYFYFSSSKNNNKKDYLFFAPALLLSILYLFKITYFMPFIGSVYHLIFVYFFWFLFLYIVLKIDISHLMARFKIILLFFLYHMYIPIIFYLLLFANIKPFIYGDLDNQIVELSDTINERFMVVPHPDYNDAYYPAIVSYITYKNNATTPMGWTPQSARKSVIEMNKEAIKDVQENNCQDILLFFKEQRIESLLTFGDYCTNLLQCGLSFKGSTEKVCVLELQNNP